MGVVMKKPETIVTPHGRFTRVWEGHTYQEIILHEDIEFTPSGLGKSTLELRQFNIDEEFQLLRSIKKDDVAAIYPTFQALHDAIEWLKKNRPECVVHED